MKAIMHDGSELELLTEGKGPFLLLPVNPEPVEGELADEMRRWGADPALGRSLIEGLRAITTVVAFDYEGHLLRSPKPDTLTPANIASDLLAVADAAGAEAFAYYGYSWLALSGLQLAIRTDRLSALIMGGFPPLGGPYAEMLTVTEATHRMASQPGPTPPASEGTSEPGDWSTVEFEMAEPQARQFVTLYRNLSDFDERRALSGLTCPRLCFAGSEDEIVYDERWENAHVSIGGRLRERQRARGGRMVGSPPRRARSHVSDASLEGDPGHRALVASGTERSREHDSGVSPAGAVTDLVADRPCTDPPVTTRL